MKDLVSVEGTPDIRGVFSGTEGIDEVRSYGTIGGDNATSFSGAGLSKMFAWGDIDADIDVTGQIDWLVSGGEIVQTPTSSGVNHSQPHDVTVFGNEYPADYELVWSVDHDQEMWSLARVEASLRDAAAKIHTAASLTDQETSGIERQGTAARAVATQAIAEAVKQVTEQDLPKARAILAQASKDLDQALAQLDESAASVVKESTAALKGSWADLDDLVTRTGDSLSASLQKMKDQIAAEKAENEASVAYESEELSTIRDVKDADYQVVRHDADQMEAQRQADWEAHAREMVKTIHDLINNVWWDRVQLALAVGWLDFHGVDLDLATVNELKVNTATQLQVLTIRNSDGSTETLKCTREHPFFVEGYGWVEAGNLTPGLKLSEADGSNDATIVSNAVEAHPEGVTVYNLEVQGDHTYFVQDQHGDAVWVHNGYVPKSLLKAASSGVIRHQEYSKVMRTLGYDVNKALSNGLRPDAWRILKRGGRAVAVIINELKPESLSGIRRAKRQLDIYEAAIKLDFPKLRKLPFIKNIDTYFR